ncbi:polysaccharide deacetylase family protein [Kaarinaea lacus]
MKLIQFFTCILVLTVCSTAIANQLTVLTYHDIVAEPGEDIYAVSRSAFVAQMDYLETHGYQPISLGTLERIIKKQESLPNKAVLLTFDDGLKSYSDFVAPLLDIYGYPSVLSVVSGWVDGNNTPPEYHNKLLSWSELRELQKSQNVDIISHSHDLHTGVQSNPQGNYAPSGVTRIFSPTINSYESESAFRQRIAADLKHGVTRFEEELKVKPVAITWPYGRYDNVLSTEADLLGMKIQLTLDDGPNMKNQLKVLNRIMIMRETKIDDFVADLNYEPLRYLTHRFVEISLDKFRGQTNQRQEELLSSLLKNIEQSNVNTVIISPFTNDGKRAFFPTQQMKVESDILNRVTHQLHNGSDIRHVYLRLPEDITENKPDEFYTDLARLNWFNGVIFDGQASSRVSKIKKIVNYFHPKSKFGHYGKIDDIRNYDFIILPVESSHSNEQLRKEILNAKGLPTKLFIHVKVPQEDMSTVPKIEETIRSLGVEHYGIDVNRDFYSMLGGFAIPDKPANRLLAAFGD